MRWQKLDEADGLRTFALVYEDGDEAVIELQRFAEEQDITAASFTGIGAFREATLAYFDPEVRDYTDIAVAEQVEVLSLVGNVARRDDDPAVHAHVVVGRRDGSAAGGHLKAARVYPTLEIVVRETPAHLRRTIDPDTGLPLLDPDQRGHPGAA